MHSKPAVKTTWYEKLAWALCPSLAWKIRRAREKAAERQHWRNLGKLLLAQNDCCKLTPEEMIKSAQQLLAECK